MPRSSMVMMPSTAVSRIARSRSALSRNAEAARCCCARVRVACLDLNFCNPGQQFGLGHFPIVLHFKDEGNIGKSRAAANLKRVTSGGWRVTSAARAPL